MVGRISCHYRPAYAILANASAPGFLGAPRFCLAGAEKTRADGFRHSLSGCDLGPVSNHEVISDIRMRDEFS